MRHSLRGWENVFDVIGAWAEEAALRPRHEVVSSHEGIEDWLNETLGWGIDEREIGEAGA